MSNENKDVFAFATLLAQKRIRLEWKSANPPKASDWLKDLMPFFKIRKIKQAQPKSSILFEIPDLEEKINNL